VATGCQIEWPELERLQRWSWRALCDCDSDCDCEPHVTREHGQGPVEAHVGWRLPSRCSLYFRWRPFSSCAGLQNNQFHTAKHCWSETWASSCDAAQLCTYPPVDSRLPWLDVSPLHADEGNPSCGSHCMRCAVPLVCMPSFHDSAMIHERHVSTVEPSERVHDAIRKQHMLL
jgi:hypothetical protein